MDSSGKVHGFKRFSDGKAIALDFPGAAETDAFAINDSGTIVGYYSKTASPNLWRHGFIYNNGQFAKLDYPNSMLQTELTGISDSNLIVLTTIKGSNATGSFLYKNGAFKKIVMPNSNVPTYASGVSPGKNLITGFSGYTGFIATCQ
jgi:probable HAF family extracellular repeat protein